MAAVYDRMKEVKEFDESKIGVKAIKGFHEQPQELKAAHYVRDEHGGVTFSSNHDLLRSQAATWHDYISVWLAAAAVAPPADRIPAMYRSELAAWDKHAVELGEIVAGLLSEGLGLDPKRLKELSLFETRIFWRDVLPILSATRLDGGPFGSYRPGSADNFVAKSSLGFASDAWRKMGGREASPRWIDLQHWRLSGDCVQWGVQKCAAPGAGKLA
ncbi:UNVERIFIED_CONTAM: hypothetical protein Sangu_1506100 [Sesamum angustifolium]|uniref:Uncharacterized protein n=1 Tax=Sesamum angustifolium TaxID=2727405 RepID=A0AAW2MQ57_9LAMI